MNNNIYSVYLDSTFQLANTLVIKFDKTISSINEYTNLLFPNSVDYNDPTTWKYYLNVSGEYHFRDTLMTVTSLDTLEEIVFNKENLDLHRATKKAYTYGSRFYRELVTKYPDQETLILGILYPIDIHKAINAKDGQIIGYPKHLIESNEYSLITRLQSWIDGYLFRWVNNAFEIAHDLYYLTWQSTFYSLLPPTLLSLRHEKSKTNEAHSFHVWTYLASHGRLNRYKDNLLKEQALWLYRNINHIKTNLGHIETFDFLTKHIMTVRDIPLSGYVLEHNLEPMEYLINDATNNTELASLYPKLEFKRRTVNNVQSVEVLDPIGLRQLLIKEDDIAKDNYVVRQTDEQEIQTKLENSLSNIVKTKALESTLFDYTGSSIYSLENILLNEWIHLSSIDVYRSYITLENPRTGDLFNLSVKDAFVFSYYFFCKSFNLILEELPVIPAIRVQRIPDVNVNDLMKVADTSYIDPSIAKLMLSKQPRIENIISTEAFNNLCNQIYISANYQKDIVAFQEHYYRRGLTHGMISQIYADVICTFDEPNKKYTDWFIDKGINIEDYEIVDSNEMWFKLLSNATGLQTDNVNSLANIQKSMTNIMIQLSSYTVQFLNEINSSALKMIEPLSVRVGDYESLLKALVQIDHSSIRVKEHKGKLKRHIDHDISLCGIQNGLSTKLNGAYEFDINVKPQIPLHASRIRYRFDINGVGPRLNMSLTPNSEGIIPLPGIDIYLAQTDEERSRVMDVYDNCHLTKKD